MADRIQMRRDTLANWSAYNPILLEGEHGYVLDYPNLFKMGDGLHAWNDLPWRGYNGNVLQEIDQDEENAVPSSKAVADYTRRYRESVEFIDVYLDANNHLLWGVQLDGNIYYGAGVPRQVKNYINQQVSVILNGDDSSDNLDGVNKIIAFLNSFSTSDTLKDLLDNKVEREDGKSLINKEYAETKSTEDSVEFLEVFMDSEQRMIKGTQKDGTEIIFGNFNVHGKFIHNSVTYMFAESPEWLWVILDAEGKVLGGINKNGKTVIGDADFLKDIENFKEILITIGYDSIDWDAIKVFTIGESPEYLNVELDAEGKVLGGRKVDGVKFEKVGFDIGGNLLKSIDDPEKRIEIKTDKNNRIISYRDSDGVLHEEVGLIPKHLKLPSDALSQVDDRIKNQEVAKNWYLPKFGKVNIKSETFYLTADPRWNTKDDVVCIQILDDTDANAEARKTLSYYYIKSTLTPLAGVGYDRTSVNENSVQLQLFPGKDVIEDNGRYFVKKITKVDGQYYLTSSLVENNGVYSIYSIYGVPCSMKVNYTDSEPDQTTLSKAIEVGKVTDVPPIKAWAVTKMLEHYCIADIDFGDFYAKNDVAVGIKYQGSGTTGVKKRGFRLTFYKNATYAKKNKVKIGEMVRLSGFNMKAYGKDYSRVTDPVLAAIFVEMWETRGKDAYPWNKDNCIYNGATGFIKSFPIELDIDSEFYGLYFFGLKKDEKNYMLDGTDESGIFVSGANESLNACFDTATHSDCEDEMMDEMSQSTADALDEFFKYCKGFTDGTIEIDGQQVDFTNAMLEERINIEDWIDYWIGLEIFILWDNAFHNCIIYSGEDKEKFYLFFYDLDHAIEYAANSSYVDIMHNVVGWNIAFWEKFITEYKDYILNRYAELRKSVLTKKNISSIYNIYIQGIPEDIIRAEVEKWGTGDVNGFNSRINYIESRLKYLDMNGFNLEIN